MNFITAICRSYFNRHNQIKYHIYFFSCDHNQYSIDYILALSKAKRKFQTDTSVDTGQNEDIDHSETRHSVDTDQSDSEQSDTLRTEYQSEPLSDSESNSSYSMEYT